MEHQDREYNVFGIQISENAAGSLRIMAMWAGIIALVTVIRYALTLLLLFTRGGEEGFSNANFFGLIVGILIGLLVVIFLYQFSKHTRKGLDGNSQADLNKGIGNLKNYFMVIGILAIIAAVIFALIILFYAMK